MLARFVLTATIIAWAGAPSAAEPLPLQLRVVSYNIHHGEGLDGKFDLPRIAALIREVRPHVVALQEVDQGTRRSSGVDQPAELARLADMEVAFGRNIDFDGGGYGTAVLTSLPIRAQRSVKLKSFYPGEQRGVQVVELGAEGEPPLVILATHLDYRPDDRERLASARQINALVAERPTELAILAGDLNATPESRVLAEFAKSWAGPPVAADDARQFTFPAEQPAKRIDYILYRPAERWEVIESRVLDEPRASDHRPLLTVLRRKD